MAKLVTKFRYYKPTDRKNIGGLVKYIATREGVERCDESKQFASPTKKQKELIGDILKQFLIEAVVLCLAGGVLGILLGHGAALLVESQLHWPIESSPQAVTAAFIVSVSIGIIFGFYPAWKASKLDPIEALRYE